MSEAAATVLEQALALTASERFALAERLLESLRDPAAPEPPETFATDAEADAAWRAELDRRIESTSHGTAHLPTVEEAMAEIRAIRAARRVP